MKAAVFGGPEQGLSIEEVPDPRPGPGEVLIRVAACGVCHTDLHYLDNGTPTFKPPPIILGTKSRARLRSWDRAWTPFIRATASWWPP